VPKLLLDNNLSPRLIQRIDDLFPDSTHVMTLELDRADDWTVWNYARTHDYVLLTKDSDFNDLTLLRGTPPKIVWLRTGNCKIGVIENILRDNHQRLKNFFQDDTAEILELYQ
jgi:predicted nuclease of predicted toxin-antitoxin system